MDLHGILEWTPERPAYRRHARIDLSLLQHQSTSEERHESLRTTRHFPASVYWVHEDRRLHRSKCMKFSAQLHVH